MHICIILASLKKRGNLVICNNIGELGSHYVKENKQHRKGNTV